MGYLEIVIWLERLMLILKMASKILIAFADKANNDDALLNDASGNLDVKDHTITGMRLRHKKIQL